MDTKKLRQKILDLAIRGKLVPQDPNDEPASVLLERIRAEKERLIKEGKIKQSKKSAKSSDTPHYENVPFEIPEGWSWCTLDELTTSIGDGLHGTPKFDDNGEYYFVNGNNLDGIISIKKETKRTTIDEYTKQGLKFNSQTIFVSINGTLGNIAFYNNELIVLGKSACYINLLDGISKEYIATILRCQYFLNYCRDTATGSTIKNVPLAAMRSLFIPIPSYQEQLRIVDEVEKLLSLVDLLDENTNELGNAITVAKSTILDLAIHGKLVPQDPNDEPAIELLKRINPKFTPCDNAHYENVPSNWTAILLGDLCFTINGLWKGKKPPFVNVGVIRNANFTKDCKLDYSNIAYLEVEAKQYEKRKLQYGDIIVEKSGGSDNQPVGRTILFEKTEGDYSFSNFTSVLRIYDGYPALPEYLNMYLQAVYQTGITKRMQTQTTGIHNLIFDQFLAIPIKLPPLAEQRRIINKVSELSQILDNISAEL